VPSLIFGKDGRGFPATVTTTPDTRSSKRASGSAPDALLLFIGGMRPLPKNAFFPGRGMGRMALSFTLQQRNTETASPPRVAVSCTAVIE
jgi:hypothetical protein